MKIGMCVNVGLDKIEYVAKCGFDYLEYRFAHLAATSDEEFAELKDCLKRNNIVCESVNCFIPGNYILTGEDRDFSELSTYIEKGMKRGKEIGLKVIVLGSGKSRAIQEGSDYATTYVRFVEFLKTVVAPKAEKYGITIVIEPLRYSETNFINTVKEAAMVSAAVGSPNIKALGDYYHMCEMGDTPQNVRDTKGTFFHAHIAEPETRATPTLGTENMYVDFLSALKEVGCERVSIEASHKDFFAEIAEGLETIKKAGLKI